MEYLEKAKANLGKNGSVCVIVDSRDGAVYSSDQKGIRPLMNWLEKSPEILKGSYAADRVIGKAAAFLMIHGGIKEVFAEIVSQSALDCFSAFNVPCAYEKKVPRILNRDQSGLCPMESCCMELSDPEEAFQTLRKKLAEK